MRVTWNAVVAVTKGWDLFAAALCAKVIEPAEEVVEESDKLRGRLVRAHLGEADDVGEQDAERLHRG